MDGTGKERRKKRKRRYLSLEHSTMYFNAGFQNESQSISTLQEKTPSYKSFPTYATPTTVNKDSTATTYSPNPKLYLNSPSPMEQSPKS